MCRSLIVRARETVDWSYGNRRTLHNGGRWTLMHYMLLPSTHQLVCDTLLRNSRLHYKIRKIPFIYTLGRIKKRGFQKFPFYIYASDKTRVSALNLTRAFLSHSSQGNTYRWPKAACKNKHKFKNKECDLLGPCESWKSIELRFLARARAASEV